MDEPSADVIHYIVAPIEAVIIDCQILLAVREAVGANKPSCHDFGNDRAVIYETQDLVRDISAWPLVVRVGCEIHETSKQLREYASWWLEQSPLFDDHREDLHFYLKPYQGLSVSAA
jgi:hypothetical protein